MRKSPDFIVLKSEAEIFNISNLWIDVQGNGRLATDSQGGMQTSDGDPRTGMFHRMQVTVGDTACSVKGV